jgi:hypothetical protein
MSVATTNVQRQSIVHSPISNTELNLERLPDAKALAGMELLFRVDCTPSLLAKHPLGTLTAFALLGCLYAFTCYSTPAIIDQLWTKAKETEGMPVVASMLGALIAMAACLLLVFVPKDIRRGLIVLSAPIIAFSVCNWLGYALECALGVLLMVLLLSSVCRDSLLKFHNSWLASDPRMTISQARSWIGTRRAGWTEPKTSDVGRCLHNYLAYEPPGEPAPGVWRSPSSRSMRVMESALLAGCIFAAAISVVIAPLPLDVKVLLVALCSMLPLACLMAWVGGEASWLTRECETHLQNDQRSSFERHADRLRSSEHIATDVITQAPIAEAEHLFLGWEPWQKFPILLHQAMLHEHVHISGRTGSGKTSMALMQKLIQLIRGHRSRGGQWSDKMPMVIIDLKGDEVLFQTAKAEAERRGQKFRFFTLEPGMASFHFNPFLGFKSATLTVPQLVQLCLDALDLWHGPGYGKGYYSQRSRYLLSQALRNPQGVDSFQDLYARLRTLYAQHPDDFRDAFELLSVIESLTFYDQLVTTALQEQGDDTIRLDRMLEDREVIYFWLPTAKESATVAMLGKLVLFNLRVAAHERQVGGKEKRQMFLLIDEFQKLAGENFQQILQQARSAGIAAILANQSMADLKTPDWDLTPTIKTNTRTKMYFSVTEPDEIEAFRQLSGEELQTFGVNEVEEIRPRLSVKELAALSDHPKRLLLQISSGSGYTQFGGLPIPVETDWPISKELSDQRAAMRWPSSPVVVKAAPRPKAQKAPAPVIPISSVPQAPKINVGKQASSAPHPTVKSAAPVVPPASRPSPQPVMAATPVAPPLPKAAPLSTPPISATVPAAPPVAPPAQPHQVTPQAASPMGQMVPNTKSSPNSSPKPQAPFAVKVPPKGKKNTKTTPLPKAPKPIPTPAVKQAFAQKIQALMEE